MDDAGLCIHDRGDRHASEQANEKVTLQALTDEWTGWYGMTTGLLADSPAIGLLFDKAMLHRSTGQSPLAPPSLSECWRCPSSFLLLVALDFPQYTVMRLILHSGSLNSGHFRALCRGPDGWWAMDDNTGWQH